LVEQFTWRSKGKGSSSRYDRLYKRMTPPSVLRLSRQLHFTSIHSSQNHGLSAHPAHSMVETIPMRSKNLECRWKRPTIISIEKSVSTPATTDAPSFLTTLLPELRNEVYQWLFHREEPIVFTGSWSFDREPDFIEEFIYDIPQEEKAMMLSPSHDIAPGINMLRTCRQVYHEAVGILYSSNSFTISVDLHRHNRTMQQLDTAANFVHRLGSQAALLKNVNIDINPLCSPMCVEHPYDDDE
jgi:hypothetical protein